MEAGKGVRSDAAVPKPSPVRHAGEGGEGYKAQGAAWRRGRRTRLTERSRVMLGSTLGREGTVIGTILVTCDRGKWG